MADKIVILDETDKVSIESQITNHASNKNNPHGISLTQLGVTATAAELNTLDGITATTAELNYVDGVTSSIQTQLNGKQATISGGASSIASSNLTTNRALVSDGSGKVAVSAVTSTELGYLDGVTSAIQTQLNGKVPTSRTVNGKALSGNISLTASDIGINNSNLLDNWCFVNPVNQKAMTQYTNEGIAIDRWKFKTWSAVNPTLTVKENSCIALKNDAAVGTACSCCIEQQFENPSIFAGKTVTISVKLKGCVVGGVSGSARMFILADNVPYGFLNIEPHLEYTTLSSTCTLPTSISTMSVVIGSDANYGGNGNIHIEIESVKLELGSASTLTYDAMPNFALELAKCQRYYQKISNIYAYGHTSKDVAYVAVPLTATMRKLPEYVCYSSGGLYVDGNIYYPTNVYPSSIVNNAVILGVTVVGVTENKMAILCDANLDLFADF